MAKNEIHPMDEDVPLETSLEFAIELTEELGSEVLRWRLEVTKEMVRRVAGTWARRLQVA